MTNAPILVATDFSARADRAIDRALRLAKEQNRALKIVHAVDFMTAETADWSEYDKRMADCVGDTDVDCEYLYPKGSPPTAIAELADRLEAHMLVIGVARYNSLGDFFLGTIVDHVLRHTRRPVLVVKQRAGKAYRDVVAGTDFSPGSRFAIEEAARLLPDADLHLVHAYRVPFESWQRADYVREEVEADAKKALKRFMKDLNSASGTTTRLQYGDVSSAIREELDKTGANLLVVGSHGQSGFRQATIGSTTSDLLRWAPVDTLVVNTATAGN